MHHNKWRSTLSLFLGLGLATARGQGFTLDTVANDDSLRALTSAQALVAENRIGDAAITADKQEREVILSGGRQIPMPLAKKDFRWRNGVTVPFALTIKGDSAIYTVGGSGGVAETIPAPDLFYAVLLRTMALDSGTRIRLAELRYNGISLGQDIEAIGPRGLAIRRIQLAQPAKTLTLTGTITMAWDATLPPPERSHLASQFKADRPDCNCYFQSDCAKNEKLKVCDYGNKTTRCTFTRPKPNSPVPSDLPPDTKPCSIEKPDGKFGSDCDGVCAEKQQRTSQAIPPDRSLQALALWRQAVELAPTQGGTLDNSLINQAEAVLDHDSVAIEALGRAVIDLVGLCRGPNSVEHPTVSHRARDHILADQGGNTCALGSSARCLEALEAEVAAPGSGLPILGTIAGICPELPFGPPCQGNLSCVQTVVRNSGGMIRDFANP